MIHGRLPLERPTATAAWYAARRLLDILQATQRAATTAELKRYVSELRKRKDAELEAKCAVAREITREKWERSARGLNATTS